LACGVSVGPALAAPPTPPTTRLDEGWLKDQPQTLIACRIYIAWAYVRMETLNIPQAQRLELAEHELQKSLALLRQNYGSEPPSGAALIDYGLGVVHHMRGDLASAAGNFQAAWSNFQKLPGSERDQSTIAGELAAIYESQQNFDAAEQIRFSKLQLDLTAMAGELADAPNSPDLLLRQSDLKMRLGLFKEAAPEIDRVTQLTPQNHWAWYLKTCLCLYLGDEPGYRAACQQMLDRFRNSTSAQELARTAKACALSAKSPCDVETLLSLAQKAEERSQGSPPMLPWVLLTRGLAEYRAGSVAIPRINLIQPSPSIYFEPTKELLLGAVWAQNNSQPQARTNLNRFMKSVSGRFPRPGVRDLEDPQDYMVMQILRREFEPMILALRP
jgi:tetratricopeptide (TPR) repeat protein